MRTNSVRIRKQNKQTDVLFFIGVAPTKVGGIELFAYHLAMALETRACSITFCFSAPPNEVVRTLLNRTNTNLMHLADQASFSLGSVRELWSVVRRVQAPIVVYSFGGILRPLPWICTLAGVSHIIYNDHASRVPEDDSNSRVKRMAARVITYPVKSVVAVSDFVASSNRREGMHNAPLLVIPNGVDLVRRASSVSGRDFLARYAIPRERRIVSQLSSLIPEKGIDIFLTAAAKILQAYPNVHFVIGGEGAGSRDYEQLARNLGISNNVTFTSRIDDPIGSGFYPASDIFCLASRWGEACGLVLLEAMSFGVPVVASRVGGIPEYVRDGKDGLLVNINETELAGAISTLLQDDERRRRMGASARQRVEEGFDVSAMAKRYADLLTGALGEDGRWKYG